MSAPFDGDSQQTYHRRRAGPFLLVAALIGLAWVGTRRPFRVEVRGASMEPALRDGEWALAVRTRRLRRGDVVVVRHPLRPGIEMVKRLTATPGDPGMGGDEWFVEGDAAGDSLDSRSLGPVPREAIAGRLVLVYAPRPRRVRRDHAPPASG